MKFKRFSISLMTACAVLFAINVVSAQLRLPRPSQGASVTQTIGVTDITRTGYIAINRLAAQPELERIAS